MSDTVEETMGLGPLNLSDADTKGFDAVDAGRYDAEVVEVKMDAVKNTSGTGKMPAGTPMLKFQFRLTNPEVENRRVFCTYVIPPTDYDPSKAAKIKGMLVRALVALGEPEDKVMGKKYDPDLDSFVGRECVVVVGKEPKKDQGGNIVPDEFNNPVKGIKPAGSLGTSSGALL